MDYIELKEFILKEQSEKPDPFSGSFLVEIDSERFFSLLHFPSKCLLLILIKSINSIIFCIIGMNIIVNDVSREITSFH